MGNKAHSSPKVEMRKSRTHGKGLFAKEKIQKGELLIDFEPGKGKAISLNEAEILYNSGDDYMLQVGDDVFTATWGEDIEDEDHLNHSCSPNAGIRGLMKIVAMRDIGPEEEITFDYAMSESSDYSFKCHCGALNCRGVVTGNDWKIPELQERYKGFFSRYLQKKIRDISR